MDNLSFKLQVSGLKKAGTVFLLILVTCNLQLVTRAFADDAAAKKTEDAKAAVKAEKDVDTGAESPQIEAVDIPTADILDPSTYAVNFRFYDQGGIASRLVIGPLKRVNLGVTFDGQNIIGSGDPHMVRPSIYFKLRAFDGTDVLPALAVRL